MAKDNSKNRKYIKEEKEKLIARMLPPESISPSKLSVETGISQSTLSTWKTKATVSQIKGSNISNKSISSKEKFLIVMETYTMPEIDLARYCREDALYVQAVKQWRYSCVAANDKTQNTNESQNIQEQLKEDKRKCCIRPEPKNKLSKEEYLSVVNIVIKTRFSDLPPSQIVHKLADNDIYIASESIFYRILRKENMQHHRMHTKTPHKPKLPTTFIANDPNQVWT